MVRGSTLFQVCILKLLYWLTWSNYFLKVVLTALWRRDYIRVLWWGNVYRDWAVTKRYVKCFYETNFFRMRPGSFIKELILEASSCLVKLESARRKGETEGREGGTFQAEGMKPAREPCRWWPYRELRSHWGNGQDWNKSSKQGTKLTLRFLAAKAKLYSTSKYLAITKSTILQALEETQVIIICHFFSSLGPKVIALILPSSRGISRNGPQSGSKSSLTYQPLPPPQPR